MSSGFVTESEAVEARKRRQEDWERVRNAEDPIERPEEPYDARSLYEKLQEQKQKKDLEYEEAHKLKNMIKGLDDDEIEFLDLVDRTKLAADRLKNLEEEKELNDYRNRVATLQEKSLDQKIHSEINVAKPKILPSNGKSSQTNLLKGIVVKPQCPKKHKLIDSSEKEDVPQSGEVKHVKLDDNRPALQCVGILPGLGCYNDSSSDENSSDSDCDSNVVEPMDLLGRKIQKKDKDS